MAEGLVSWLPAGWDAPAGIRAGTSTRHGGCSPAPYDSLNLAAHVGDAPENVARNRAELSRHLKLPSEPVWLNQVHGNRVITAGEDGGSGADGCYTREAGIVCAVMTADCVPLLLCNRQGTRIAAVHVGWRGFCAGVIGSTLALFEPHPGEILAWIGPHIGADDYEVGGEVRDACIAREPALAVAFRQNCRGRWQTSLETLVRHDLLANDTGRVDSAGLCTYRGASDFFSYRRDGRTGRMVSMIWMDK